MTYPSAIEIANGRVSETHSLTYKPYWWEAVPAGDSSLEKPVPPKCDVAIIGSGFTGLSAALTFARNGRHAVVFERGAIGIWREHA